MTAPFETAPRIPRGRVRSVWAHLAFAGVSALMLGLCFAPVGFWPLAYVALVPVSILAVRTVSLRRLAWTTGVVFCAWWLVMIAWLIPVTLGGYVALGILQGAWVAAAMVGVALLHARFRSAVTLVLPLVWVSVELLRSSFPAGGFGWFIVGHSQAAFTPGAAAGRIAQVADLFGELGVSFLVLMTNGLIVDLVARPIFRRASSGGSRLRRTIRAALFFWALVMTASWIYGRVRIAQFDRLPAADGPRVAVIQTELPQDNKSQPQTPDEIEAWRRQREVDWHDMLETTRAAMAAAPDLDLVAWPETMTPGPINEQMRNVETGDPDGLWDSRGLHRQISVLVREAGVPLFVGSLSYGRVDEVEDDAGRLILVPADRTNSALLYHADGLQSPKRYDKIHRVPFGEYLPWIEHVPALKGLFLRWLSPYDTDYTLRRGTDYTVFEIPLRSTGSAARAPASGVFRVATPICYEDVSPAIVRRMVYAADGSKRADMLVNLTNSAWYPGRAQRPQHLQIATLRCIENRVPTARSVNTGISGFIDAVGRVGPVIDSVGAERAGAGWVASPVRIDDRVTVFGRIGRVPAFLMAMLVAVWLVVTVLLRGIR